MTAEYPLEVQSNPQANPPDHTFADDLVRVGKGVLRFGNNQPIYGYCLVIHECGPNALWHPIFCREAVCDCPESLAEYVVKTILPPGIDMCEIGNSVCFFCRRPSDCGEDENFVTASIGPLSESELDHFCRAVFEKMCTNRATEIS